MSIALSHIAIACPMIDHVAERLKVLSLLVESSHHIPSEKVRAAFLPVAVSKNFRLELIEPTGQESPITQFLTKRPKGGLHHLSFEVDHIETWQRVLEDAGIEILKPGIRKAARGRALFIHPSHMAGVLIELEEIHELPAGA